MILRDSVRSHACFDVVMLKYGHQSAYKTPQPFCRQGQKLHVQHCCRLFGEKNRSLSSVTVSSIVEVTVDRQRSAPGSAALELQRSNAPGARVKTTLHKCCVSNMRRASTEQQGVMEKLISAHYTVESNTKPLATRHLASPASSHKEKHNNQNQRVI